MRSWTKSACVALAWSILPVILVAAGPTGSVNLAQANTRTSSTEIILTSTLSVAAAPVTATTHAARYVVQDGDTLSGIATRFAVRGGWPALYAANRQAIGPDPNVVHAGTVLTVPGLAAAPRPPTPGRIPPRQHPPAPRSSPRPHSQPQVRRAPATTGMPQWLKTMLLAVGLLILAAFVVEPLLAVRCRRRRAQAAAPVRELRQVEPVELPGPQRSCADRARIILADHDRLVVTRSRRDDTVYVLRPPGADPRAILRVARLVVPESRYGELAEALGVPASWPME